MAKICDECRKVHFAGIGDCKKAQLAAEKYWEELKKEMEEHLRHCPGCPNPETHVLNFRKMRKILDDAPKPKTSF